MAVNLLKRDDARPWREVDEGLAAAGFGVAHAWNRSAPCDLIVTWNCYGQAARAAEEAVGAGARHVVLENGYLRTDRQGRRYYLAEEGGYAGLGRSLVAASDAFRLLERFDKPLDITPLPDRCVLICGQMGGDYSPTSMPYAWVDDVCRRALDAFPSRQVVWRPKPVDAPKKTLTPSFEHPRLVIDFPDNGLRYYLRNAWRVIVWTSNAATDALWHGVPVIYEGPSIKMRGYAAWNCHASLNEAAQRASAMLDRSCLLDAFAQIAWDQWTAEELAAGEPWRHL